jgi:hypothetical protein
MVTMPDLLRCNRSLSVAKDFHMGSLLSTTGSARGNVQAGGTLSVFSSSVFADATSNSRGEC